MSIQKEIYRKQRRRVQQIVRRLRQKGYVVDVEIPATTYDYQKGIEYLAQITPKILREEALIEPETGELIIKRLNKKSTEFEKSYRQILENVFEEIEKIEAPQVSEFLRNRAEETRGVLSDLLYSAVLTHGERETAVHIQHNSQRINYLIDRAIHSSKQEEITIAVTELGIILNRGGLSLNDYDNIEQLEEYYES